MQLDRSSGLLLHITSLPSPFGIGDLGPGAYQFADFLAASKQRVWQMLPVVPIGYGYSPYSSPSTFAGNPLLLSPERLRDAGLLTDADLQDHPDFPIHNVDYEQVIPYKLRLLKHAFERFEQGHAVELQDAFEAFCTEQAAWLNDYALFMTLKAAHGEAAWTDWPEPLAQRHPDALRQVAENHDRTIRMHRFWQFLFDRQWNDLRAYCGHRHIRVFGDLPIYVAHDSADVWAHPNLFHLDERGRPTVVAGVPPDYFSETGQRWGNPIYRWGLMQDRHFAWWMQRLRRALTLFDLIRLDHFRGFAAYWEIPANEPTAVHGRWVEAPGAALLERVEQELGSLPLLAENLGIITDDVTALMKRFNLPGMAVLQFGFGGDVDSGYLPHNFVRNLVAYTGTHDNDTLVGWWVNAAGTHSPEQVERERAFALQYLGLDEDDIQGLPWRCIRLLLASVARLVVTPVQDVLGLGSRARMNTPGREEGNWSWRLLPDQLTDAHAERLRTLTQLYGRASSRKPPGF